jgi:hypothetical protein
MLVFNSQNYTNGKSRKMNLAISDMDGECMSGSEYLLNVLSKDELYLWMSWHYLYNREWWLANGFKFKEGINFEDMDLTFKCLLNAEIIVVCNRVVYGYQNNDISITQNVNRKLIENLLEVIEDNIRYVDECPEIDCQLRKELNNNFSYSYFTAIIKTSQVENHLDRKILRKKINGLKWICKYVIHGKHYILAKIVLTIGINPVYIVLLFRRKIREIRCQIER